MDLELRDKVVLVTAASKGLGHAIALEFAKEKARIVICARGEKALGATEADLRSAGGEVLALRADITSEDQVEDLIGEIVSRYGRIDVLVNNAAIATVEHGLTAPLSAWHATIDANLFSVVLCSKAVLPYMGRKAKLDVLGNPLTGGSIVNVASISGLGGIGGKPDFAAAKGALIGLTKAMARDLASEHIRVNMVNPGLIRTPLAQRVAERSVASVGGTLEEFFERTTAPFLDMKRFGTPRELASVVVFLASPRASYVTGKCWSVDGGTSSWLN